MIFYSGCCILILVMKMKEACIIHQRGIDEYYKIWHTALLNMIIYIHSGKGSIVTAERNYPLTNGCLCFIGANKFHYTLPDAPHSYDRSKIFVSDRVLEKILFLLPEHLHANTVFLNTSLVYAQIPDKHQAYIENLFFELQHDQKDELYQPAVINSSFLRLLIYLTKNVTDSIADGGGAVQTAVEYINRHISEALSIDDICAAVHMSKFHFCRKFKQTIGMTVMQYILKTRIVAAKNMLENEALSISEISEKCGFSSVTYFCRVFKDAAGHTPLQYRKKRFSVIKLENSFK